MNDEVNVYETMTMLERENADNSTTTMMTDDITSCSASIPSSAHQRRSTSATTQHTINTYRLYMYTASLHRWINSIITIDLDLDSTRIQGDALGHTPTPFWSVLSCHLHFLPDDSYPNKSLLTVRLQFVCGRPGPLLNPGISQCSACRGMHWWSIHITCPSQWNSSTK